MFDVAEHMHAVQRAVGLVVRPGGLAAAVCASDVEAQSLGAFREMGGGGGEGALSQDSRSDAAVGAIDGLRFDDGVRRVAGTTTHTRNKLITSYRESYTTVYKITHRKTSIYTF